MTKLHLAAVLILATSAIAQAPPTATGTSFDQFAAQARARMMALDTDHDGRISKDEFAARADAMPAMRRGDDDKAGAGGAGHRDPSRMFARLDTNNDGHLDAAEINALLARRFARVDSNHDGVLTADERHAMRGMNAPDQ